MSCGCVVASPKDLWEPEDEFVMEAFLSGVPKTVSEVAISQPGKWWDFSFYRNDLAAGVVGGDKTTLRVAGAMTSNSVLTYSLS
jgi:hypothetical protein